MNKLIIDPNTGISHVIASKDFRYYVTVCGKFIHDDTEPINYKSIPKAKHKKCKSCLPMSKIIEAHS